MLNSYRYKKETRDRYRSYSIGKLQDLHDYNYPMFFLVLFIIIFVIISLISFIFFDKSVYAVIIMLVVVSPLFIFSVISYRASFPILNDVLTSKLEYRNTKDKLISQNNKLKIRLDDIKNSKELFSIENKVKNKELNKSKERVQKIDSCSSLLEEYENILGYIETSILTLDISNYDKYKKSRMLREKEMSLLLLVNQIIENIDIIIKDNNYIKYVNSQAKDNVRKIEILISKGNKEPVEDRKDLYNSILHCIEEEISALGGVS